MHAPIDSSTGLRSIQYYDEDTASPIHSEALLLAVIYVASPLACDEPLRMRLRHLNTLIQLGL